MIRGIVRTQARFPVSSSIENHESEPYANGFRNLFLLKGNGKLFRDDNK